MNKYDQFLKDLGKLQPEQVLGLARVCGIRLFDPAQRVENGHAQARDAADILKDIIACYVNGNRAERRWLAQTVYSNVPKDKR